MRKKTSSEYRGARETSENVEIEILPETEYSDDKRYTTNNLESAKLESARK